MNLNEALETLNKAGFLVEADEEGYYTDKEIKEILAKLRKTKATIGTMRGKYRIAASDNTCLGVIIKDDPDRWYFKINDMEVNTTYMRLSPKSFYGTEKPLSFETIDEACEAVNIYCEVTDYLEKEKEKIVKTARQMLKQSMKEE